MFKSNCGCGHHWVPKILAVLVWVAGVVFFWSGFRGIPVWGYDPLFYAWSVVVLAVLAWACNYCGCCCGGRGCGKCGMCGVSDGEKGTKICSHEGGCKCGDCDRCH